MGYPNKQHKMSYLTEKAIKRLVWRFKDQKAFTPNKEDISALNSLISLYKTSSESINYSQEPFAKLYLFLYFELLAMREYQDKNIKPANLLSKILNSPFSFQIQDIQARLNGYKQNEFIASTLKANKITSDMTDEQYNKAKEALNKVDLGKITDNQLSYDEVKNALFNEVNKHLENYN